MHNSLTSLNLENILLMPHPNWILSIHMPHKNETDIHMPHQIEIGFINVTTTPSTKLIILMPHQMKN